ncbi:hypothetical protein [Actinotalea sp. K2]|uniref:hypothetical protein n=1 Tax=Actinotalea sp. K2 TaxID=2939438 RepID=UPI00201777E5|nr:hypothetical protein [Actinotalea sp. K2]MCL3862280.1 hypothetical protein [Actinotalea sp. K2]
MTPTLPTRPQRLTVHRPGRRAVAALAVAPALFLGMSAVSGGPDPLDAPVWTALVALIAVLGAAVLATYLPAVGSWRHLSIGCTPCAVVAGLTVPASAAVLSSGPGEVPSAVLALLVAGFGFAQRLRDPGTCARP